MSTRVPEKQSRISLGLCSNADQHLFCEDWWSWIPVYTGRTEGFRSTSLTFDMSCFVILAEARTQLSPYENRTMIHSLQILRPQLDARFREHDRYVPNLLRRVHICRFCGRQTPSSAP